MRTLAVLLAMILTTVPLFLPIKTASAGQEGIPNPHQYKYASIAMPESLDPGWAYYTASSELIMNVYEPLIAYDHESTDVFVPVLTKKLPTIEKVTKTLTNTTVVNMNNPACSNWVSGTTNYHLFGWQDKDDGESLTVGDVVWLENLADHEYSFHGVVRSIAGNVVLQVERVRIYFEIRTDVHFQPWTSDIPGYEAHTADLLTTEDVEFTFERNCVLDHEGGPMWMIMLPTLGIMTTREYVLDPTNATMLGHMIDNAFESNGTHFWFNLVQTFPPFLQIITQSWGSIMNKDWIIALQNLNIPDSAKRWTGWGTPLDYDNWLGYTNPEKPDEIDKAPGHMCGTGPYKFDFLIENDRWQIKKFDGYWQGWPAEGRSPDDYIDTVICLDYSADPTLAFPLFLSDDPAVQCDSVYVPRIYVPDLIGQPGVRTWGGMPQLTVCGFMMSHDPEETSIFLPQMPPGTNKHDFFGDIHIRKAFAHLINHTEYIQAAFLGEAKWPNSIIIEGLKYHNPTQVTYDYSLTAALNEFKLAFGGSLTPGQEGPAYKQGFHVILVYNWGNKMRQKFCEMVEYTLEQKMLGTWPEGVNDDCVEVVALYPGIPPPFPWELSAWLVGWGADFPDADNFARPYIHTLGDYAFFQRVQYGQSGMHQLHWDLTPWGLGEFGDPAQVINNDYVDTVIEKAVLIDDSTTAGYDMREQMYYHLQDIYYQECASFPIYQSTGRRWERDWVQGWYYNPISPYSAGPGGYYYHVWKGWVCHGDLDFTKDTANGDSSLNYLTCDYKDLAKFRGYYTMPNYILGHRMRYADYNNDDQVNYIDLGRFRNYYVYYPQWTLSEGLGKWHWPPPPH